MNGVDSGLGTSQSQDWAEAESEQGQGGVRAESGPCVGLGQAEVRLGSA